MSSLGAYNILNFNLTSHNGFSLDLKNIFFSIEVYEEIYNNSMSVRVGILDTENLIRSLPIIGQEKVLLKWDILSDGEYSPIEMNLRVTKISKLQKAGQKTNYILEMTTIDFLNNFENRVSEYVEGPTSEIVQQIFDKDFAPTSKGLNLEPSEDDQKLVVPNLTPLKSMTWLSSKAHTATDASYLFFENNREYMFKPITKLYSEESKNTFYVDRTNNLTNDSNFEDKNTLAFEWVSNFDVLNNISKGFYNSTVETIDIVKKEARLFEHSFYENWDDYEHIEPNPFQDISGTGHQYKPKIEYVVSENDYGDLQKKHYHEDVFLKRLFQLQSVHNIKCEITVYADTKLAAGDMITLNFGTNFNNETDDQYTGSWLITAMKHKISRIKNDYRMQLECVRDSVGVTYPQPIPILKTGASE